MSSSHLHLSRALGRWVVEDADSRNGTFLNGSPVNHAVLKDGDILEAGHTFFVYRHAIPTVPGEPVDRDASELDGVAPGLATLSPALAEQFEMLRHVARSQVSVLLQGETGTGKEVIARTIHALSARPGAFVPVNCGAIPEALVESELFGYRRGAFSGAIQDRIGLARSANRGTLFLDEIGDLPLASQAKFLRVLQERQVVPLGGTRPVQLDIRFCAATHRELETLRAAKQFREDLLARISGITVRLPPLRDRREDLGLLIASLLKRVAAGEAEGVSFKRKAALALLRYSWPLNVRELEKSLESAVVLSRGEPIDVQHLPEAIRTAQGGSAQSPAHQQPRREKLVALLEEHRGNVSAVARALGKDRVQIRRWLKHFELEAKSFRTG